MRYIPTSPATVHALKTRAKLLKREGKGQHSEMLELVSIAAGYDEWSHVTRCAKACETFVGPVQLHLQPLEFEPPSIDRFEDYSGSIAFPLNEGARRSRQLGSAQEAGAKVSADGKYILFEGFPPFDEGILIADDYTVTDANY